jgi:hypothetical protein
MFKSDITVGLGEVVCCRTSSGEDETRSNKKRSSGLRCDNSHRFSQESVGELLKILCTLNTVL